MALLIPEFLQTKQYSAKSLRAMLGDMELQPGVFGATDFDVTQRAAGATMSVDVAAGAAWVAASGTRQGNYHAFNDAVVNLAVGNNATGNPRVDQVILRIYDTTDGAAIQDLATLEILPGTAAAGAQIANPVAANYRSGAAVLPNSSIRLADILVANGAASITNANIVDRRPWARGAFRFLSRVAGDISLGASGPIVLLDSAALHPRIECSGVPIKMGIRTSVAQTGAGPASAYFYPLIDGVAIDGMSASTSPFKTTFQLNTDNFVNLEWVTTPAAGSHTIGWGFSLSTGTAGIAASAGRPLRVSVEEIVRQNADNS